MAQKPRPRILTSLAAAATGSLNTQWCKTCSELLRVSGLGVAVAIAGTHPAPLCSSDETAAALDELQATLGQGPSIEALRRGDPAAEPDVAAPQTDRWVAFAGPALALGAAAVFAFPMRVGAARLGVLTLYQRNAGPLGRDQYADALVTADAMTQAILAVQARASPGALAGALDAVADDRAEIHQATGMVAAQLDVSVAEALVVLRARAYAAERPLLDVARDVIGRRLHLD